MNGTYQLLIYSEELILLDKKNTQYYIKAEILLVANKQICLRPNAENIKYMALGTRGQRVGNNHKTKTGNKSFQNVAQIKFWKQQ